MEPTGDTPQMTHGPFNLGNTSFWYPPEDHDKPTLPYLPGLSIQIRRHTPPSLYATTQELDELEYPERPPLKGKYLLTVTQSEAVALNPPAEGVPPPQTETAQLTITSPIAIGAVRGAQIVGCTVTQENGYRFRACAKIYDPLYYNFKSSIGHSPQDCVDEADRDYIVETWAYNFLGKETDQIGSFAPKYYGSWIFTLPITLKARGLSLERPIRLVLIEFLHGASIQGSRAQNNPRRGALADSFHYPEEYRLEVLARAMDGYVKQEHAGIEQNDFSGRNIILVIDNEEPNLQHESEKMCGLILPRVVLIDYNNASKWPVSPGSENDDQRPINPALRFWRKYLFEDIAGWVPSRWSNVKVQQEWLLRRFGAFSQQKLYRPLPGWLLDELAKQQASDAPQGDELVGST